MKHLTAFALAAFLTFAFAPQTKAQGLDQFIGVFTGTSNVYDGEGHGVGERHVDMIIERAKNRGFNISLISVALVDGRRDVVGVKRRVFSALFEPSDTKGMYIAANPFNPFEETQATGMFEGKPLEWAQVTDDSLTVYTLTILDDGRYETQIFERVFAGEIMETLYERKLDGTLERRTQGLMVRSK